MSPVIRATTATLAGILNTISSLSGGSNGPAVTDFNNKSINILPPLPGPNKVGVVPLSIFDYDHHSFPLCDFSNDEIPDAACHRPREITTSLFYPACPSSNNQRKPVLPDEQHFAPVFTPSILAEVRHSVAGGLTPLHNLMSQAVDEAPSCKGQYPMVIFAPTAGGQRQAYTQAATELASLGHVVLTVDYPYLSSAVQSQSAETVQLGTLGDWINTSEALLIQLNDLQFVYKRLLTAEQPLSGLPFWTNYTTVQLDACIFGHGSGGRVAQMMVETHVVKCGGPLEGILTLPAPFNRENTAADSGKTVNNTRPSVSPSAPHNSSQDPPLELSPPTTYGWLQLLKFLKDNAVNTLGLVTCSMEGDCGAQNPSKRALSQKRSVGEDPCYDEYNDEVPCDKYDPSGRYDGQHRPSRPYPPPGIFPPNMTWPPSGDGKIPGYDHPWDDEWDDYYNDSGDHGQKYGHKDCDHYDGNYDNGYEGDYGDEHPCDQGHDHYREWDRKHHCHGHVDDHDEDDHDDQDNDDNDDGYDGHDDADGHGDVDDYDDNDYDDNYGHEDDYDGQDHDTDCCKKYHHHHHHQHGHVDDHDDDDDKQGDDDGDRYDKGDDYEYDHDEGDEHGHVDDWDNEDQA